jgi:hypothetical protein
MSKSIISEAIDKTELMTLEWVVSMLKKYPTPSVIEVFEGMIANRKLVKEIKEKK